MKTLITSLFLLLTCFSTSAQDLDFVHSYGPTEDGDSNDQVHFSRFEENYDRMLVGGQYFDEINLEIGSMSSSLEAEMNDMLQGFLAIYSDQNETETYYNLGSIVTDARMITDSTFIVIGKFIGIHDFDPRPEGELWQEGTNELSTDGFAGYYHLDGTPIWVSFFKALHNVELVDISVMDDNILIGGTFTSDSFTMVSESDSIELNNSMGINSFLFAFEPEGGVNWYKEFDMDSSSCKVESINVLDESLVVTLQADNGDLEFSLNSVEQETSFNQDNNSIVVFYEYPSQNVSFTSLLETVQNGQFIWPRHSEASSSFGIVTANQGRGDGIIFSSSVEVDDIIINPINELDYLYLNSTDSNGLIQWTSSFPYSDQIFIYDLNIDQFGYTYVAGYYQGELYQQDAFIIEENASPLNNGFIMKLDPLGNLVWAHNIPSQQGELEVNSVSVNGEQDILISGYYTGNHDFDFSDITQYVGNFEEENGFLARYTQEPNEAQVFLNVPILHTEIEEAGATSLVYVSINREISEDVVVEATPDEQIDLGNGAGQPVELTFTPDGDKIMSLDVTAFDDLDVEGDHTGTVTFNSSGETNFASLEDQTITFDIIDNDPDAIDEQNAESQISVYPNPATDEITIDYPKNLSAKTFDLVRILDGNGRAVLEIKDHPRDQTVSVEGLPKGTYILKVSAGGKEYSLKLVIQ